MSVHTRKCCPHCGKLYETYTTYSKNFADHSGSPFRDCRSCGNQFFDKDFREPGFYEHPQRATWWQALLAPLYPFGVAGIFIIIIALGMGRPYGMFASIIPFAPYAYLVYTILRKNEDIYAQEVWEYKESQKRLANRDYILRLLDNRYPVPSSYLRSHHPDLVNYKPQNSPVTKSRDNSFFT